MSRGYLSNIIVALVFFAGVITWAQTNTAEITGTVTDATGAVVSDATVTVVNTDTNAVRTVKTNGSGLYDFPALTPGIYTLTVEMQGFGAQVRSNVELQVAQVARFDTILQVGNIAEKVEVTGGAPVLETDSTAVGTVIENQRIVELPLNGRNYLSLAGLAPGVTLTSPINNIVASRQGGTRASFTVSAGGQRAYFNHYTLDGMENTDPNFNTFLYLPSLDDLQEFKVETGTYPAEYGHNLTQINVTSKSGANQIHGSLFEFLRNSAMDAKNFFDNPHAPIPPFKRNQFGGSFGGPVVLPHLVHGKDKLFFFFDYEGLRERKALTRTDSVASQAWLNGNFSNTSTVIYDPSSRVFNRDANGNITGVISSMPFGGNIIPPQDISPITTALLKKFYPAANNGNPNVTAAGNYITALTQPTNADQVNSRIDYVQSANMSWIFRWAHTWENQNIPGSLADLGTKVQTHTQQGMISNTWLSGGNMVNEFKAGVNYMSNLLLSFHGDSQNVVQQLGIPNYPTTNPFLWGAPGLSFSFGLTGVGDGAPFGLWDGVGSIADNFSLIHGTHSMKFGAEVTRTRFNTIAGTYAEPVAVASGQYTTSGIAGGAPAAAANGVADGLLGYFGNTSGQLGGQVANLRWSQYSLYAQDSWRVNSKLTINYGIRWEDMTPPVDKNDSIVNIAYAWNNSISPVLVRAGTGNPLQGAQYPVTNLPLVRDGTFGDNLYDDNNHDFAPRLGLAYSLNSKTVIRTGVGIYFAHEIYDSLTEDNRNAPFSVILKPNGNTYQPNLSWQQLFPMPYNPSALFATDRHQPTSRSDQWTFAIQRQLASNSSLELTYLGTSGMYLGRLTSYDTGVPAPGNQVANSPFPFVGGPIQASEQSGHSTYNSLQARFQQRFTHGFTLLSSFAYGHSIDNTSSDRLITQEGDLRNPLTPWDIRGNSAFDVRLKFTNSFLYELPFGTGKPLLGHASRLLNAVVGGWQLGSIWNMQTGLWLSVGCSNANVYQNGGTTLAYPQWCYSDATGLVNANTGAQNPGQWFNPKAFVDRNPGGPQYRYGNSGRNVVEGPGPVQVDASLAKHMKVTERQTLEFRAEVFNVANHPIFNVPNQILGGVTTDHITSTIIDSRQFQFGLRYTF